MPFSIRPFYRLPLASFSSFISLIVLLVLSSAPAHGGEWVKVHTIEISESTVYAEDPSTIHRKGIW
jgi:hypothetical protein